MKALPMYFPPQYDNNQAITCLKLVNSAYDMYNQWLAQNKPRQKKQFRWQAPKDTGFTFSTPIWSSLKRWFIFDDSEPFGFSAKNANGDGYLVFRGTESSSDWLDDADVDQVPYNHVAGYGMVHHGFLDLYNSMRESVLLTLNELLPIKNLYIAGHSLGCGISSLAVPDVDDNKLFRKAVHYNFASPRVGDPQFTQACNNSKVNTFRVVNTCDLVPQVPLSAAGKLLYSHIGTPIDFTAQYGSVAGNHDSGQSYLYALEHPQDPASPNAL